MAQEPMVKREFVGGDGSEDDEMSLSQAVDRLAGYGWNEEDARRLLLEGVRLRTPFAFYEVTASG
jgi:hypothetical protein